jgi:hypothetical protein
LLVINLYEAKAIVNIFLAFTVTVKRLSTTVGIEKIKQWYLEGKVRETLELHPMDVFISTRLNLK